MSGLIEPPEYEWSCGTVSPPVTTSVREADQIEAIMMLSRAVTDEHGKFVMLRIPPSFALAILQVVGASRPQEAAVALMTNVYGEGGIRSRHPYPNAIGTPKKP